MTQDGEKRAQALRERATRARFIAGMLTQDADRERLREYAAQLEAEATALDGLEVRPKLVQPVTHDQQQVQQQKGKS